MESSKSACYFAFDGTRSISRGTLRNVVSKAKQVWDRDKAASILIFQAETAHQLEVDFHGNSEEVIQRARLREHAIHQAVGSKPQDESDFQSDAGKGRGRPKLGVVAREVTLLPRQWAWLKSQPGGASSTLRKLVESARLKSIKRDQHRQAQDTTYRFMHAVAGDLPGFEEASRGLFNRDKEHFRQAMTDWPAPVRRQCIIYAAASFE